MSETNQSNNIFANNKRIAKNTILLYLRMLLTLAISLYTSRVILKTLGVDDFGIYNVVGGIVIMFSFLSSTMSSATQRFYSFELGKSNLEQLSRVFKMTVNIHMIIAVVILILAETLGLWFLNAVLIIPDDRIVAANWVFQFSIITFMVTILSVPYNSMIIAHERMSVFAYVSILEVSMKLLIVYILIDAGFDKLILYSIFVFVVSLIIWLVYKIYCNRSFNESSFKFYWDKNLYKVIMNYSFWNLFGNLSSVVVGQGINIILNVFFGIAINAARGIAFQINGAVNGFVSNFQMALNPPIVKSYANNNLDYMHELIFKGSKYSFYLLFIIALPIILESEFIISNWLTMVPDYTIIFCQLILVNSLIDCISGPLGTSAIATGNIKKYQIYIGSIQLIIPLLSYFLLFLGNEPQITSYVSIFISVIALFGRIKIISSLINISIKSFIKSVLQPILLVVIFSLIIPISITYYFEENIYRFIFNILFSTISTLFSIYIFGLKQSEREYLKSKILSVFKLMINKK